MSHRTSHPIRRLTQSAAVVSLLTIGAVLPGTAANATIPAPPAGFTEVWSSDFAGTAGTGLDTGTWQYDTGPGSSFGTGEIETMTSSTQNLYHDGSGHLMIKATHTARIRPPAGTPAGSRPRRPSVPRAAY